MTTPDFEKLGAFYLGRLYDPAARARTGDLLLYDSRDLVTHAVCVGMTGSGKTGLCIGLIEEAAIDGIPAIIIDPKGDLSNLLLTFPSLAPADFRPWVNQDDAARKGLTLDALAEQQAALWKKGLAEWGQDGARIQRLRDAADVALYTPGSTAGLPVSVLRSFDPPPASVSADPELLRERIAAAATSLLALLSIDAEPATSREHILLSSIFAHAWSEGRALDLPALISAVQTPPFTRLGVMEIETVFPSKDRFALAMALNTLVASPGFAAWTDGEPLDLARMLHTDAGKPRVCVFSIAHLSDPERMFFVALLLNHVLAWTRAQPGASSLRAILYMDEIAGYIPPVANPPSKPPLLTLLKQARAFGVGVVLATQNPVDLDYKGLSNAGTWFIGRLQTDRDKQRVLDGLEGASQGRAFDRPALDRLLSALTTRVFLMNNIHDDAPVVFETRWCLSYLRGPLTRDQIRALRPQRAADPAPAPSAPAPPRPAANDARPVLPAEIHQRFLPAQGPAPVVYRPALLATARIHYADSKLAIDTDVPVNLVVPLAQGPVPVDWSAAESTDLTEQDAADSPAPGARFEPLPAPAATPRSYDAWMKSFVDHLARAHRLELMRSGTLDAVSRPDESERDFRVRLAQAAREKRDEAIDALRARYAPKIQTLEDRLRRAAQAVDVQKSQASQAKVGAALSFGAAILGALLGRKKISATTVSKASTAARGAGRAAKESADVDRAQENAETLRRRLADLHSEIEQEIAAITASYDPRAQELERVVLRPKKSNIAPRACVLAWAPRPDAGAPPR